MDLHPATIDPDTLFKDCEERRTRRSGPGGQRRNKARTAIEVAHRPTGVKAEASEHRDQAANRRAAYKRLRRRLAVELRSEVDPTSPPSDRWRQRLRGGRLSINPDHDDYPAMLAEAMDRIAARDMDVRAAAESLGTSVSQLLKLLKAEPPAFEWLNRERRQRGLRPLGT